MLFNYGVGAVLEDRIKLTINRKVLLIIGITVNLALLGYYKYANFFVNTLNSLLGTPLELGKIALPLAISFFTFLQIAYIVDAYKHQTDKHGFLSYSLFVCFFPHLLAGPLVHHKALMDQFEDKSVYRFSTENLAVGLTIFTIGLFKKTIFADNVSAVATQIFGIAAQGGNLSISEAWIGALSYTLQLYFDFSGYSDMAIGSSRMMGILLPINFNSPYKSIDITDFWRRWHITLSNFLRDYLYIPLGGNRLGETRRNVNLMLTMLLGGLWHGASWTFVIWGGLHGVYLVINHQWKRFRKSMGWNQHIYWWDLAISRAVTFIAVVVGWVFFRAENMNAAIAMLKGMFGFNGLSLPPFFEKYWGAITGLQFRGFMPILQITPSVPIAWIALLLALAFFAPNTQELMSNYNPALDFQNSATIVDPQKESNWYRNLYDKLKWQPNLWWSIIGSFSALISILSISSESEFIYFQF